MNIKNLELKIISDSRGEKTLEARIEADGFSVSASVPSGKSRGAHEAFVLAPDQAVLKFNQFKSKIKTAFEQSGSQKEFDKFLINLDGTHSTSSGQAKTNIGGNFTLAFSMAFARVWAKINNQALFHYLRHIGNFPVNPSFPKPIFNVINGGAHVHSVIGGVKNKMEFQEFQIIPQINDFGIAFSLGKEFYRKLGKHLESKFGKDNVSLGNEAGFSAPFSGNEEAIEILDELIVKNKYPLRIGLDIAASQFQKRKEERGKRKEIYIIGGKEYSSEKLLYYYLELIERHNIISIEDPFGEEEFEQFAKLKKEIEKTGKKILLITDDLTVTNSKRLKEAIDKKSGNAILIKPNQIGTISETLDVVKIAKENSWQTVVSHRSGETTDDFIADLSVAIGAWGIKAGAPAKPERLAKYERLLSIDRKYH